MSGKSTFASHKLNRGRYPTVSMELDWSGWIPSIFVHNHLKLVQRTSSGPIAKSTQPGPTGPSNSVMMSRSLSLLVVASEQHAQRTQIEETGEQGQVR
jgi:hypothetical protein